MSLVTINEYYLHDIANAIRYKHGSNNTYKPRQMASAIKAISTFDSTLEGGTKEFIERTIKNEVTVDCDYFGKYSFAEMDDLTAINAYNATSIKRYAFYKSNNLYTVNMPNVTTIDEWAFLNCENLCDINLPSVTSIKQGAFENIGAEILVLPSIKYMPQLSIAHLKNLTTIDLGSQLERLEHECIYDCPNLTAIIIRNEVLLPKIVERNLPFNVEQFLKSYEGDNPGYIYVPRAMKEKYETFEYTYDSYGYDYWDGYTFRAIEDYPEICG